MIFDQQEKPSIDDVSHFGTKGMRWGVRKSPSANASTSQIKGARRRVDKQSSAIGAQRKAVRSMAKGSKERRAGEKKLAKMHKLFLNNPDRATALRMTHGERAVTLALGITGVGVGVVPAVGLIGASSVAARRIESKQGRLQNK